jgi:ABC-type Mn2+/Zn2+ transport system permease subunit
MLHALAEPWTDPLTRRALLEMMLLGLVGGVLGCWIVFFELAYSAESLAHGLLPGLVLAALAGVPLLLGAGAGLLVAAVAIALAGRTPAIGHDTAIAVVVTTLVGLGSLLALSPATPARLQELLFGDLLGASNTDLVTAGALALTITATLAVLHPSLTVVAFDRTTAAVLGRSPLRVDAALGVLLALAVLAALQGLGSLLAVAVLVAPAAAARQLTHRLGSMMTVAVAIAVTAAIGGLYASYYLETAAGASIAAALVIAYALAQATSALRSRTA